VTVSNFEEAEDLLRGHPVGTFLVRIDSERGKKCGFTVSWVDSINIGSNRNSYHVMHKRIMIEKDENQQSKFIFDKFEKKDLVELVNEFKTIDRLKLQKPYPFSKKMQDFYYGIVKHGDDVFRTAFGQKNCGMIFFNEVEKEYFTIVTNISYEPLPGNSKSWMTIYSESRFKSQDWICSSAGEYEQ